MIGVIEALKNSGKVIVDEDHDWGYQLRFVNEAEYCGKFLVLEGREAWGSLHYHKIKKETFVVLYGAVYLDVAELDGHGWSTVYNGILVVGDMITIMPNARHKMQNSFDDNTVILEVSTHDDDDDTYRVKGW